MHPFYREYQMIRIEEMLIQIVTFECPESGNLQLPAKKIKLKMQMAKDCLH